MHALSREQTEKLLDGLFAAKMRQIDREAGIMPAVTEQPQYQHDCEACVFLGRYQACNLDGDMTEYDLYFCMQGGDIPTVLARYGDDGPDYRSGLDLSMVHSPELREATRRALLKFYEAYLQVTGGFDKCER